MTTTPSQLQEGPILADPVFMQKAIALATENVTSGAGGPFGAVIVRDGAILATGVNCVTLHNDPTAHAEIMAIRFACRALNSFQLTGCVIYTSCEPCPMCLAALYWSRCAAIFYGNTAADAAQAGFDDSLLYSEIQKPIPDRSIPTLQLLPDQAIASFHCWRERTDRIDY
ncbi:MAG TPA: nucleoside deaminase [Granulicella sp.]|jgi:guanine deaminase|nr:nucleoside deaminase [Granulicella sp.]